MTGTRGEDARGRLITTRGKLETIGTSNPMCTQKCDAKDDVRHNLRRGTKADWNAAGKGQPSGRYSRTKRRAPSKRVEQLSQEEKKHGTQTTANTELSGHDIEHRINRRARRPKPARKRTPPKIPHRCCCKSSGAGHDTLNAG